MLRIFRSLRQAHRDRQKRIALGVAHLDKMGWSRRAGSPHQPDDGSALPLTSWEAVFDRPEWRKTPAGHKEICLCCGSSVEPEATACSHCGAVWEQTTRRAGKGTILWFAVAALVVAVAFGYLAGELIADQAEQAFLARSAHYAWSEEFIEFVRSYLRVSVGMLSLILATYVYEGLGFVPKGKWRRPVR